MFTDFHLSLVWVNDYHLMLLPALLRSALPVHTPIGFFLHVAFPSSEIFRCLVARRALLSGILGADLIGFQTANYARHFRQTVARILSLETVPKGIQLHSSVGEGIAPLSASGGESLQDQEADRVGGAGRGRFVDVGVFAMGIDVKALKEKRQVFIFYPF
jgi:trehalose 6-phosphate synthase complex regulatory subunit